MKTLIVDDLVENRKLLENFLTGYGLCDVVDNGQDALDMFDIALVDNDPYDLILLDIMMPHMDGQQVLGKIRATEHQQDRAGKNESVIIMVTALSSPRSVLDAFFKGGCTDYIEKPVSREILFKKLKEYQLIDPDAN